MITALKEIKIKWDKICQLSLVAAIQGNNMVQWLTGNQHIGVQKKSALSAGQ